MSFLNKYNLKEEEAAAFWNDYKNMLPQKIDIHTKDYNNFKDKIPPICKLILVSAELNAEDKSVNNYEGLELIRRMRLANIKIPILICSSEAKKKLERCDKYGLLKIKGCYYMRLEQNPDYPTINFEPLSQIYLEDIKYSFLDLKGTLYDIKHDISTDLTNNVSIDDAINIAQMKITKLFDNASEIPSNSWFNLKNDLQKLEKEKKLRDHNTALLDNFLLDIIRCLFPDESDSTIENKTVKTDKTPWTVLYVEDSKVDRELVKSLFENKGIRCTTVSNAEQCFKELENDNSIVMVITDWRLKKDKDNWQEKQGYEILDDIAKGNYNIPTFVMITNRRDAIIRSAKSMMPYKVKWYFKTSIFYNDYERQLFVEDIFSTGNEAWEIVNGLKDEMFSKAGKNEYSFKEMYLHFLRQDYFELKCKEITDQAFINYCFGLLLNDGRVDSDRIRSYIYTKGYLGGFDKNPNDDTNISKNKKLNNLYAKLIVRLQYLALIKGINSSDEKIGYIIFEQRTEREFNIDVTIESENTYLNLDKQNSEEFNDLVKSYKDSVERLIDTKFYQELDKGEKEKYNKIMKEHSKNIDKRIDLKFEGKKEGDEKEKYKKNIKKLYSDVELLLSLSLDQEQSKEISIEFKEKFEKFKRDIDAFKTNLSWIEKEVFEKNKKKSIENIQEADRILKEKIKVKIIKNRGWSSNLNAHLKLSANSDESKILPTEKKFLDSVKYVGPLEFENLVGLYDNLIDNELDIEDFIIEAKGILLK